MLEELIQFAKCFYASAFGEFSDEQIREFFLKFQHNTLLNVINGQLEGFAIYEGRDDKIIIWGIACSYNKNANFKFMRDILRRFQDRKVVWLDNDWRLHLCQLRR